MLDQRRVQAAFDRAADYARHAGVQRTVAQSLADRIGALALPETPRILEIGCGTGFLTEALLQRGVDGEWLITDKAPGMVNRCRMAIGEAPRRRFAVLDGEYGLQGADGQFDLVCASMTMQWFDDLVRTVPTLLQRVAPGGHLVFNTLTAGTFAEWRAAHRANGLEPRGLAFPDAGRLQEELALPGLSSFAIERHVEQHRDARDFLLRLKRIGAATAPSEHTPLAHSNLRRVMQSFEATGSRVSYEVLVCQFRQEAI